MLESEPESEPRSEHQAGFFKESGDDLSRVAEPEVHMDTSLDDPTDSATLYDVFLEKASALCVQGPIAPVDLKTELGLEPSQLNAWLKKAVTDGKLQKLARPGRYRLPIDETKQRRLFGNR